MNRFRHAASLLVGLCVLLCVTLVQAQGTPNCTKPNVLLVVNKSSTMGFQKWQQALAALGQIVPQRNNNTRFGLVLFDTNARVAVTIRDNALTALGQAVATQRPSGQANHRRAMTTARTYLSQEVGRDTVATREYFVVLVTDGTSNDGNPNADIAGLRRLTTANGRTKDVKTYVLLVSPSSPAILTTAQQWATSGGTSRPYLNNQASQLNSALAQNEPTPSAEQCNNQDDDCDGQVDENLQRSCLGSCPGGTTAAGTQTCTAGQWSTCQVQKRQETCNGRDDDCDGSVDNNLQPFACQTACGTGTRACVNGRLGACNAPQPAPETCDGKDNDCDGEIDERCPCKDGDSRPCGKDTGECTKGTQVCQGGAWSPVCQGEGRPTGEQCDGKDNDCDGLVDENLRRACANACGRGVETCTSGKWQGCTAPTPKTETCNGQDDDCDGFVDEGCSCQVGQTRPCGTNTGSCQQGIQVCLNGQWGTNCINSVQPTPETCDRQDNDCNGLTDDNLTRPCTNPCGSGTERCSFGRWIGCNAPTPTQEACDGKDNDCDGQIDEGITRSCYTGPAGTQGVGACKGGNQACNAGKWGPCTNEVKPVAEACGDNSDNDCDGQIDETCPCQAGQTRPCGITGGACKQGTQSCVNGQWSSTCTGAVGPKPETCNGIDDDCDGQTDEQLTQNCKNNCGSGMETCRAGQWVGCTAPNPRPEVCGNNADDDCDGQIDENCPCQTGQTRPCGSSTGECQPGTQECVGGGWSDVCKGGVTATKEVCDGKDNDCNGQIDDGVNCGCKDGDKRACYTGPASTRGKGTCKDGAQVCSNGQWGPCQGETLPGTETCDNQDNDCDGNIDNSVSRACQGPCGTGTQACAAGKWGPCSAPPPAPEVCDGKDNDCDGVIDEGCPCRQGQTRPCGSATGACKQGTETCTAGKWGACTGAVGPTPETCNGQDDDCNGKIDDGSFGGADCTLPNLQGPCAKGKLACVNAKLACQQVVKPTPEVCDNLDNDCDGNIDNGVNCPCKDGEKRPCYLGPPGTAGTGVCKSGAQVCQGGQWSSCQGQVLPTSEVCDGQDNNCDGDIDEGLRTRPCTTPCGPGTQQCAGGRWGECSGRTPTPEVCDGADNDCNGQVDDNAPCPPNAACQNGQCVPTVVPDAGEVSPPDVPAECRTNADCPAGKECKNGVCVDTVVPDDTNPDNTNPENVTPDAIDPGQTCQVNNDCRGPLNICANGQCSTFKFVCRWGRCHYDCATDADCTLAGVGGSCKMGLCVPQCVVDNDCASGEVCRAGWCKAACRADSDCQNGGSCIGYACVTACASDSECTTEGGHCSSGKHCLPRCNLAADCPAGFACVAGKCEQSCSKTIETLACGESKTCHIGQCQDDCSKQQCPSTGAWSCKANVCTAACSSDGDCQIDQACLSGFCVQRCSIQDDCPNGSRCNEGVCYPGCQKDADCPTGLSCLVGRCVNSCQPGGGSGVDAGNGDGGGTPDQSSDTGPQASCSAASSLCTGDSCQRTCSKSSDCPTGYGCGKACFGCTETICLPPCRIDGDCPSQYVCQRGMCSLGCQNDQQCSQGETCQDKRCVRSCTSDADCPLPQSCENNICVDPDPLKKDRGTIGPGDLPKLKLAGGCGCQSTSSQPLTWGMLLLLLGVLVPVVRRKRQA